MKTGILIIFTGVLWVSTNGGVYIYDKTTKQFTPAPANIGNRTFVKGISNQPYGIVVLTRPDSIKNPVPGEPSTLNSWTTSYVDFYSAAGLFQSYGHRNDAAWYKGRIWTPGLSINLYSIFSLL